MVYAQALVAVVTASVLVRLYSAHQCPPCKCFDCGDPETPCLNGAVCDAASGHCLECPEGFAGDNCGTVLCGSPAYNSSLQHERPVLDGKRCKCDDGWGGINCNVCLGDEACSTLLQKNATCRKRPSMHSRAFKSCGAILPPFYRRLLGGRSTNATTECLRKGTDGSFMTCHMQFWLDYAEQFWCELVDCTEGTGRDRNTTTYGCAKASCRCVKDARLCNRPPKGLVDLSPMLQSVTGPASFECTDDGQCVFKERVMNDYFVGGIRLACQHGECLVNDGREGGGGGGEGRETGTTKDWKLVVYIFMSTVTVSFALFAVFFVLYYCLRRQRAPSLLSNAEEETKRLEESHVPATVSFKDLSYRLSSSDTNYLLKGVSGVVNPGEVLAIIGGSGAGKTTCLDIIAQKAKRGVMSGDVLVNDNRVRPGGMAEMSGFVDQETKLLDMLTVQETLTYSAMLRLPNSMSLAAKMLRVEQTIAELGLEHVANCRIGSSHLRGISGGEQRRVAIACEMVTAPRILFLDEPTSGLDAHSAYAVVEALIRMARKHNRTVILTIHQPRSNIFNMFDRLLLLAAGRMVYSGAAEDAVRHFSSLGYAVPVGFNTADYLIDITMDASIEYSQGQLHDNDMVAGAPNEETSGGGDGTTEMDDTEMLIRPRRQHQSVSIFSWRNRGQLSRQHSTNPELRKRIAFLEDEFVRSEAGQNLSNTLPQPSGISERMLATKRAGLLDQFKILAERHWKTMVRDRFLIVPNYLLTVLLAALTSLLFSPLSSDMAGVQNRLGALFFQCAYFAFAAMTVVEGWGGGNGVQRAIFLRERSSACYSLFVYYMSRTILEMLMLRLLPPLIFTSISYYWIGFYPRLSCFVRHSLTTVLFTMATASILQVISLLTNSDSLASLLCTLFLLYSLLFGGFLLNKEHIGGWFRWLPRFSPFNYAFEGLIVNELREVTVRDGTVVDVEIPGRIILKQFGFDAEGLESDIAKLAVMLLIGVTTGFVTLKVLVKEKR